MKRSIYPIHGAQMQHSLPLNLPVTFDFEAVVRRTVQQDPRFHPQKLGQFSFNKENLGALPTWLGTKGLFIIHQDVFYTPPNTELNPHIDLCIHYPEVVKLNWQFGAQGSRMFWYKRKKNVLSKIAFTATKTAYLGFTMDQLDFVESAEIGTPSLVTASEVHAVQNDTDEGRYILCVALTNRTNTLTFALAHDILNEYA